MKSVAKLLLLPAAIAGATNVFAANPTIIPLPSGVMIDCLSDNGLWGVSTVGGETEDGQLYNAGGSIWDITAMKSTEVVVPTSGRALVADITDNGLIAVGSCSDRPAYYKTDSKEWVILPLPSGTIAGSLLAVTPDGTRAVGYAHLTSEWDAVPTLYDLTTNTLVELPNLPSLDMNHDVSELNRFCSISADGRYVLGRMSEQILKPVSMCAYVYDTQTDRVNYIGFTASDTRPWTPSYRNCFFIDQVCMSPNGRYVTGGSYVVHEIDGKDYYDEYYVAFRYDTQAGTCDTYDGAYDSDVAGYAVTDGGTVLVSVPAVNPYSAMAVRVGNYYYPLEEIFSQAYGMDYTALTGNDNTGKPISASADGKVLSMVTSPTDGYILKMDESWEDAAKRVNLLNTYTANPAAGSVFSSLTNVKLTFSRSIDISGAANRVKLLDADGKTLQSALAAEVNGATLSIRFRQTELEADKAYTVSIPAGFVTMQGDATVATNSIDIPYTGRRSGAVGVKDVVPADGSTFARLDASTNCVFITFDASLAVADGARAQLRRKGEETVLAELSVSLYTPNSVILYPASRQYLYDGTDYEVVLPAGSVTDLSGQGANEPLTLTYSGNYIREVSADDKYLFFDNCDNYAGFMYYDGDRLAPGSVPSSWGFTADVPWYLVRDNNTSTDMAMAAHSMFANGGKADDWAVTPQLFIPDSQCYLSFDAQSYMSSKADRLKVYAYACDNGYSSLNADIIADIRAHGDLIFDEQLSAGANDETMADEWTNYVVKLPQYTGKNIYIAFVNENENQSAVFINHVEVVHDMLFLTSLTSKSAVVQAERAPVEGVITLVSDILAVSSIDMVLKDAAGHTVSTISESGLSLTKGHTFPFAFPEQLPLQQGIANRFTIEVTVNGTETTSVSSSVKNLMFAPTRRVVLEEYSGRDCSNCPLGFRAMENLEKLYPGQIIPIVLRTYESDPLGTGMSAYTTFLGLNNMGAPSGMVNRSTACYPMVSVGNDYRFSGQGLIEEGAEADEVCWLDAVVAEMQSDADADIDFTAVYDGDNGSISVKGAARFALNSSRNVNLFTVVLEDKCATTQSNGMRYYDDPDLGEWGRGGIYAQREVELEIDHVGRGSFGTTFNGTPGLIPFVQKAGEDNGFEYSVTMPETVSNVDNTRMVVMMIDSDTDALINANVVPVSVTNSSISEIEHDTAAGPIEFFDLQGRKVTAPAKGRLLIKRQGSHTEKIIF